MAEEIQHFLLVYDLAHSEAEVTEYGGEYELALAAYSDRERAARENHEDLDIVLVGADSIETVRRTHSSYFELRVGSGFDSFLPA